MGTCESPAKALGMQTQEAPMPDGGPSRAPLAPTFGLSGLAHRGH